MEKYEREKTFNAGEPSVAKVSVFDPLHKIQLMTMKERYFFQNVHKNVIRQSGRIFIL